MHEKTNESMKKLMRRRIAVKGVIFAVWAVGMLAIALQGGQELSQNAYFYMTFAIVAVWVVSTMRDVRQLRRVNVDGQGS